MSDNIFKTTLGQRIRSTRKMAGLSLSTLAKNMGESSVAAISSWERGVACPELPTFVNLCKTLDVSPSYLLGFSDTDDKSLNRVVIVDLSPQEVLAIDTLKKLDPRHRRLAGAAFAALCYYYSTLEEPTYAPE